MNTVIAAAIALACWAGGPAARAADGDLDPSFSRDGKKTTDFAKSTDLARAVAPQADGKIVVAGTTYRNSD